MKSHARSAKQIAPTLVGMSDERASTKALDAGCAVQFIVMDGRQCGRNATVSNAVVCLFSNRDGVVTDAVVGSRGIYAHPAYLAAPPPDDTTDS